MRDCDLLNAMMIRNFEKGDLEKIIGFKKQSSKENFPGLKYDMNRFKDKILKTNPDNIKAVEIDNNIVGYIWFEIKKFSTGKYGVIRNLFIEPEYRHKGLAQELMRTAENQIKKETNKIRVTISKSNEASVRLCKKMGYKETRYIMEKTIS